MVLFMLTSKRPSTKFRSVFTAKNKHAPRIAQLLGTALLLFVFFLPLHLHFSAAPQLGNECSCLCGTRTQLVLNDAAPRPAPALWSSTPIAPLVEVHSFEPTKTHRVRGPPAMAAA
jgi:hypothetical protein